MSKKEDLLDELAMEVVGIISWKECIAFRAKFIRKYAELLAEEDKDGSLL